MLKANQHESYEEVYRKACYDGKISNMKSGLPSTLAHLHAIADHRVRTLFDDCIAVGFVL